VRSAYAGEVTERKSRLRYRAAERVPDPDPFGGRPPIDSIEIGHKTYVTATVQPLDVTGVRTVAVGTTLWFLVLVCLLPFYSTLEDDGHVWWIWTCVAGIALGGVGLEYCRRRRRRLAAQPERDVETSPLGAAGL
jgi:Protein of unknown function (DUF2530)